MAYFYPYLTKRFALQYHVWNKETHTYTADKGSATDPQHSPLMTTNL